MQQDIDIYAGGWDDAVRYFERSRAERRTRHPQLWKTAANATRTHTSLLTDLREQGFAVLPNAVPLEIVSRIRDQIDEFSSAGVNLLCPPDVAAADPNEHWSRATRVARGDVAQGEEAFRHRTNLVQVRDPLVEIPDILEVALRNDLLDVAGAYLGCFPAIGYVKARKSFANGLPRFDTEHWHVDGNAATMVKAFLVLHDMDASVGSHEFARGSHSHPFDGFLDRDRWSNETIEQHYGSKNLVCHEGRAGDVIFEITSGFHRAGKPRRDDHSLVIITYSVHPDIGVGGSRGAISKARFERMTPRERAAAEFLTPSRQSD